MNSPRNLVRSALIAAALPLLPTGVAGAAVGHQQEVFEGEVGKDDERRTRLAAAEALGQALTDAGIGSQPDEDIDDAAQDDLVAAVAEAIAPLAGQTYAVHELEQLLSLAEREQPVDTAALVNAMRKAQRDLAFEPRWEAALPAGFPTYTPVGNVELKRYPAARMAKAQAVQGAMFFRLFRHIKANEVAMTTPVLMTGRGGEAEMGFYYEQPDQGQAGQAAERVEVLDVPPMDVLAIGVRGRETAQSTREAAERLDAWLAAHPHVQASGPLRVMGYNSPFVPAEQRFYEVQYPVSIGNPK